MKWWAWLMLGTAAVLLIFKIWGSPVGALVVPDDADVEALARMITSENGRDSLAIRAAVGWCARNEAERRGLSVALLVMPTGIPGEQGTAGHGYASTARPATPENRSLAFDILSGKVPDPTGGATNFDAPRTQAILYSQGRVKKTPEQVAEARKKAGLEQVQVSGVDPNYMRFWRYA